MSGHVNQNSLKICIIKRLTTYIVGKRSQGTVIFSFNGNEYGKTLKTEHHIIDIMWFFIFPKNRSFTQQDPVRQSIESAPFRLPACRFLWCWYWNVPAYLPDGWCPSLFYNKCKQRDAAGYVEILFSPVPPPLWPRSSWHGKYYCDPWAARSLLRKCFLS